MPLASSVWASASLFLSRQGGGSPKISTGLLKTLLALQCSLRFTAKKNCPIQLSHENKSSVVGLGCCWLRA